jgi:hypothetical protein
MFFPRCLVAVVMLFQLSSVVPLHSFKAVATLQAIAGASPFQRHPLLIYIDKKAGHGAGA